MSRGRTSISRTQIVDYRITPEDRTRFKRCRRQWDFASPHRRDLEPAETDELSALPAAFRDALAVYYYPGTWDWQHELKQTLVHKAMRRSLEDAGAVGEFERGTTLVDCYDAWAATVDDFAPVKIQHDVVALVRDPTDPEKGLLTPDESGISYACRVDLLAVDAADEYWVMRHQIVDDWRSVEELVLDEEATAACWAWEQDYIGMEVAGTIHNEIRIDGALDPPADESTATGELKPVPQHEASGGGRSIPQHVRMASLDSRPIEGGRIDQRTAGPLRRTRIRRSHDEIAAVASLIAAEAAEMAGAPVIYPSPGPHCLACDFRSPCLSMFEGADPEPLLVLNFRPRSGVAVDKPRLGQATWGFGRGGAPPDW
jgi:hypothetical protein